MGTSMPLQLQRPAPDWQEVYPWLAEQVAEEKEGMYMAEDVEQSAAEKPPYEACYLYHASPEGVLSQERVESEESYDALWAAGWRLSPAAFGIETAPANPPQTMPMGPEDPQMRLVQGLLTALQETLQTVQTRLTDLVERVSRMETTMQAQATHAEESSSESPSRRRG